MCFLQDLWLVTEYNNVVTAVFLKVRMEKIQALHLVCSEYKAVRMYVQGDTLIFIDI